MSKQISENVLVINDKDTKLVSISEFPYAVFPYTHFNYPQSAVFPYVNQDVNLVVCSQTSSGKSDMAVMCMSYEWYENGRSSMFVAPMRALAQEKIEDWTDDKHPFSFLNMSICTGDFRITDKRIQELNDAHIVVLTPEMLAVRCRNITSEKSQFIYNAGLLVQDEGHILTVPGRGDAVEVLFMEVAKINPNIRFVLLSATMTNSEEIGEWLSKLNGKKTVVIESDYRPVMLQKSYPTYNDKGKYYFVEKNKTEEAIKIIEKYPDDKFLVCYHTKASGYSAVKMMQEKGITSVFFNADQSFENRTDFLRRFQPGGDLRVLCSTSSLFWGNNLPSKHVIIVGPYRGFIPVENYDLFQAMGRAGRPKYDTEGYVHMLLPKSKKQYWLDRLAQGNVIDSTLATGRQRHGEESRDYYERTREHASEVENIIAHHLIAQIHNGLDGKEKICDWFKNTLAYHQAGEQSLGLVELVIKALTKAGLTKIIDNKLIVTRLGRVASLLYLPPFNVAGYHKNIKTVKDPKNLTDEDIAFILSNVNSNARVIYSKKDEDLMNPAYMKKAYQYELITKNIIKPFVSWYGILQGDIDGYLAPIQNILMSDAERTVAAIKMLDGYFSYGLNEQMDVIALQLKYAVKKNLVGLVRIPGIGRAYAMKLFDNGIQTYDDLINASDATLMNILKFKSPDKYTEFRKQAIHLKHTT